MWEQVDYSFDGEHFTVPTPHNVLPKPYGKGHPPIWVACGNPPTFDRAGELGIGAIAFNFEPIFNLRGRIEAYKEGVANCTEPIGQFKNDNVMITNSVICCETREEAREIALRNGPRLPRHDGEPVPRHDAEVAGRHHVAEHAAVAARPRRPATRTRCSTASSRAATCCAAPPTRCPSRSPRWGDVGMDQLVFGLPIEGMHHEEVLACLELFGDKVIPEFDKDRTHSTDRYRATAKPKFARFTQPLPEGVEWPTVIPESALAQLLAGRVRDLRPCRATPPPPRNGCSAKRSGCSRGAGSTR